MSERIAMDLGGGLRVSPFCRDLCTKKRVFLTVAPMDEDELLDGSGHSWCALTCSSVGQDGDLVDPEDCRNGRSCFRPYGSSVEL